MNLSNILTLRNRLLSLTIVLVAFLEVSVWCLQTLLPRIALQLMDQCSNLCPYGVLSPLKYVNVEMLSLGIYSLKLKLLKK